MNENRDYRLNPEVKAKWVAALRSGKYVQGTGRLCRDGKYCCLGVLCDVMGATKKQEPCFAGHEVVRFEYGDGNSVDVLPHTISNEVGITIGGHLNRPIEDPNGTTPFNSLWELNDCAGYDFNQIAQVIEEQF